MKNKKLVITVIGTIILLIIAAIIIINILYSSGNIECNNTEKMAIKYFIETIDANDLKQKYVDSEDMKIKCAINSYKKKNFNGISYQEIKERYDEIFGPNEKITSDRIRIEVENNNTNTDENEKIIEGKESKAFQIITNCSKMKNNEVKIIIDIVEEVDEEKLRNYYSDPEKGVNIISEIDKRSPNKKIDLTQYLNKDNYKELAVEVKELNLIAKFEDSGIRIVEFN